MCHSVDMYMPEASRRAAEERIIEGQSAAAAREQRVVDAVSGFVAWLRRWLARPDATGAAETQDRIKAKRTGCVIAAAE